MYTRLLRARILVLLTALAAMSACIDSDPPQVGRVVIDADPATPLHLVVSTNFGTTVDPETQRRDAVLFVADTTFLTGNFDQEYSLATTVRIYVQLRNDEATPEQVRMRVFLDNEVDYDVSQEIADGEVLQYMYTSFAAG